MTIQQIASRLVELCRSGEYEKAQEELYSKDAISIEPYPTPAFDKETKGLPAILEKGRKWAQMVETVHGGSVSEPMIGGNAIAVSMTMDLTMKERGRINFSEICVYEVKDGKIVSEQFFV